MRLVHSGFPQCTDFMSQVVKLLMFNVYRTRLIHNTLRYTFKTVLMTLAFKPSLDLHAVNVGPENPRLPQKYIRKYEIKNTSSEKCCHFSKVFTHVQQKDSYQGYSRSF